MAREPSSLPGPCRPVRVLHRGELRDVCRMLDDLEVAYEERHSVVGPGHDEGTLIVATPQRVLELSDECRGAATVVAVCEGFSRTLAARLDHAEVDFVLRRPVHPTALRLLLLHALYRGPEKRRTRRVTVGATVRVRIGPLGWRRRTATLLEISSTGARIGVDVRPRPDARVSLLLPPALSGGRAVRLRARVARVEPGAPGAPPHAAGLRFERLDRAGEAAVARILDQLGRGPAPWKDAPPSERPRWEPLEEAPERRTKPRDDPPDRRGSPRLRYARPVLVKGDGASRVLMGRDLSAGGMRVVRDPRLAVGDELKIALYGEPGIPPLMLQAEVAREDGPFLMLRFRETDEGGDAWLERLLGTLPVSGADESGHSTPMVVSEILEQR